jgi:AraC-like DNA-binding protein
VSDVLGQIELIARGGTIALLLLWSWLLLREHRGALAARAAVAMAIGIICYVLPHSMSFSYFTLPAMVVDAGSVMAPPLFWLFAHIWFTDAVRVGRRHWLIVLGFAVLPLVQIANILVTGEISWPIWLLIRIGMIAFGLAGMWIAWRGRDNDLVEPRRRFRATIIWIIGGFVIWVALIEIPLQGGGWTLGIRMLTHLAIAFATLGATAALYGFTQPELFAATGEAAAPPAADPPTAPSPVAARLSAHMRLERPYRAEGLTIAALAAQLEEQEYRLRRLINGELGHRNFASFLNGYRLAEVREALSDPAQRDVPIITIALDAGFGSLGPFNRAFREDAGMTPTEYRAAMIKNDAVGDSETG